MSRLLKSMISTASRPMTGRHAGGLMNVHGLVPDRPMQAMHPDGLVPSSLRSGAAAVRGRTARMMRGGKAPPPITMPKPSGPRVGAPPAAMASGKFSMSGAQAITGIGLGALTGGVTGGVYANKEGSFAGGFARGALTGAVAGAALGAGMPWAAQRGMSYASKNKQFMSTVGSYSDNMVKMTQALQTEGARTAMFAAGGMLGGAFGGSSHSKKRGFNRNRGNSFSR